MEGPPQSLPDLLPRLEALLEGELQAMALRHKVILAKLYDQMGCGQANPVVRVHPDAHPARVATPFAVEPVEMEANPKSPAPPATAAAPCAAEALENEEHAALEESGKLPTELPSTTLEDKDELSADVTPSPISPTQSSSASLKKRKSNLEEALSEHNVRRRVEMNVHSLVTSHQFEIFFALTIVLNTVVIAIESSYYGIDMGRRIGFPGHDKSAKDAWPGALEFFGVAEMIFGVLFFLEVVVKLPGLKGQFFRSLWNLFDTFLVIFWLVDTLMQAFPVGTGALRIVRLARLMRIVRILRTMSHFDSLIVMVTALQGSMSALLWVGVLLCLIQMLFGLVLGQLLTMYLDSAAPTPESSRIIFEYFGTFPRATLSMFELTLGNFAPVARILQEDVGGFTVLFSILHKVTFGFACVGVINGVFMQETFKVAQYDDAMMLRDVEKQKRLHTQKMQDLFEYADDSLDGAVCFNEWIKVLGNENAQNWFAGMGLSIRDADLLFALLETSGDGKLNAEELATGVSRLKGPAKSLDVALLLREQEALSKQLQPANVANLVVELLGQRWEQEALSKQLQPVHVANLVVELLEQRWKDQQLLPKGASRPSMENEPVMGI